MKDELIPRWMSASITVVSLGHEGFLLQVSLQVATIALSGMRLDGMQRIFKIKLNLSLSTMSAKG